MAGGGSAGQSGGPGSRACPWSAGAAARYGRAQPPPARQATRLCWAEGCRLGGRADETEEAGVEEEPAAGGGGDRAGLLPPPGSAGAPDPSAQRLPPRSQGTASPRLRLQTPTRPA